MTKQDLLKRSIAEFKDNKNNALLWQIERHFTKSGYCYILKVKSSPLCCAIHYNANFETDENVGKYENNDIAINTREKIAYNDCIVEYKGMNIAISSIGAFNETMGIWHYNGQSAFKPISDRFLITDLSKIKNEIGSNCLSILMNLALDYPLVPSYYSATDKSSYIMASVDYSLAYNQIYYDENLKRLRQYRKDNVKLSFVNIDTLEAMRTLKKITDLALEKGAEFGINNIPMLKDENFYQKSFNWKSLVYSCNLEVNYHLSADYDDTSLKHIKQVFLGNITKI